MYKNTYLTVMFSYIFWGFVNISLAQQESEFFETVSDHVASQSLVEVFEFGLNITGISKNTRPLGPEGNELIKHFEGWEPKAYNDPSGYCTIGFGHLIALRPCTSSIIERHMQTLVDRAVIADFSGTLSEVEGGQVLDSDTLYARSEVLRLTDVELDDHQFDAVASFVFNVGSRNFEVSTLRKRLNAKRFDLAALEFQRWIKSDGKVLRGLKIRRACERSLFEGKSNLNSMGKFQRSSCEYLGIGSQVGVSLDIELGEGGGTE